MDASLLSLLALFKCADNVIPIFVREQFYCGTSHQITLRISLWKFVVDCLLFLSHPVHILPLCQNIGGKCFIILMCFRKKCIKVDRCTSTDIYPILLCRHKKQCEKNGGIKNIKMNTNDGANDVNNRKSTIGYSNATLHLLLLFSEFFLLPPLLQRKTASSNLVLFPILSLHLF